MNMSAVTPQINSSSESRPYIGGLPLMRFVVVAQVLLNRNILLNKRFIFYAIFVAVN